MHAKSHDTKKKEAHDNAGRASCLRVSTATRPAFMVAKAALQASQGQGSCSLVSSPSAWSPSMLASGLGATRACAARCTLQAPKLLTTH
jgi:hypothetical protein